MDNQNKKQSRIIKANNEFAKHLYKILARGEGNLIFSPISIHTVLSMSHQGAQGSTSERLASVLQIPDATRAGQDYKAVMDLFNNVEDVTLHMANKIFLKENQKLLENFNNVIKEKFLTEVQMVNFEDSEAAAKTINEWVEMQTQNEIQNLIKAEMLNRCTRMVLVNAVYFRGGWKYPFPKDLTETRPFYLSNKETVDVQMMHLEMPHFHKNCPELSSEVLMLPYGNTDFSLIIILPYGRDGIHDLEKALETYDISSITEDICNSFEIDAFLPRFKIDQSIDLKEALSKLGLDEIFDKEKANFRGIMPLEGDENLYVSHVVQKACIEVDEEGSTAAAASDEGFAVFMCGPRTFIADHPFMFLLRMKECIIFMGKIMRP